MDNQNNVLTPEEMDAIGEVMNISMGSSATAISSMLDKQVIITTPKLTLQKFGTVDYSNLEPAVLVKIRFSEGISGTNLMLFRNHDMHVILNLLMGNEEPVGDEEFVFDDLSMSAACEVMNQMMGAAATALSDILEKPINITTPEATVVDIGHPFTQTFSKEENDEDIISISFDLTIKDVMNSNFVSVVPIGLARSIVSQLMKEQDADEPPVPQEPVLAAAPAVAPAAPPMETPVMPAPAPEPVQQMPAPAAQAAPPAQAVPVPQAPAQEMVQMPQPQMQPQAPQQPPMGYPMPQQQPMYNAYAQQPAYPPQQYGYMPQQPAAPAPLPNAPAVKKAKFPDFSEQDAISRTLNSTNMSLLMNVPLDVSVEIGKTKRKIKEIADFGQGTVIELEKQAGAPVDIMVNGQLLAHGDVVVIDDNFGVRITEIVGTKDLMDSLNIPMA